jgi:polysaccharide pyruvyl transferase WcaK-like protein
MSAFIGMKLHSVILAMCAHVPSIMLEYRPKALDFMASVGLEQFNVRTSDVEPRALFGMLFELVDEWPHLSEIICQRLTKYKQLQESRARELIAAASQVTFRRATAS